LCWDLGVLRVSKQRNFRGSAEASWKNSIVIKTSSSDPAMEALKWSSLRTRRDEHILTLVRKYIDRRCPQYFNNYFVFVMSTLHSLNPAEQSFTSDCNKIGNSQEISLLSWKYGF